MRLDSLTRLIESADYMTFRELAMTFLKAKGYREVSLADGWRDGGTDVRCLDLPPNPQPIAFQVTVERDWRAKLKRDAKKVREHLNLLHMTLISARRVPEAEFNLIADEIWQDTRVRVTRYDCQSIASHFRLTGRATEALSILGIDLGEAQATQAPTSFADEAAYSFAFFSDDARSFRESTIRAAILHSLAITNDGTRPQIVDQVIRHAGLAPNQESLVESEIDRMLQTDELTSADGIIHICPILADSIEAMKAVKDREWAELRQQVIRVLQEYGNITALSTDIVDSLLADLGGLALDSAKETAAMLKASSASIARHHIRDRLRHLSTLLDSLGVPEGTARSRVLENLARLATSSSIGQCLVAGEVFCLLSSSSLTQLVRALGGRSGIEVIFDASVAIPVLCGLLFQPADNSYATAANHAYRQLSHHGIHVSIPIDYVEEAASHLLHAWRNYSEIIDIDPDLAACENAFVSHYVSLRNSGDVTTFSDYLDALGLRKRLRDADFSLARNELQAYLVRMFDRYGMRPKPLGRPTQRAQRRAEEAISHSMHEHGIRRPQVLVGHDVRTIAFLIDGDSTADSVDVLCTNDRLHFAVRAGEEGDWQVMRPVALGDLLASVCGSTHDNHATMSPVVVAKHMSEAQALRGAEVWDTLVRLESGKLNDADLLREARAFKQEWTSRSTTKVGTVEEDWEKWKANRMPTK